MSRPASGRAGARTGSSYSPQPKSVDADGNVVSSSCTPSAASAKSSCRGTPVPSAPSSDIFRDTPTDADTAEEGIAQVGDGGYEENCTENGSTSGSGSGGGDGVEADADAAANEVGNDSTGTGTTNHEVEEEKEEPVVPKLKIYDHHLSPGEYLEKHVFCTLNVAIEKLLETVKLEGYVDELDGQECMVADLIDPVDWLAEFLFRNNPLGPRIESEIPKKPPTKRPPPVTLPDGQPARRIHHKHATTIIAAWRGYSCRLKYATLSERRITNAARMIQRAWRNYVSRRRRPASRKKRDVRRESGLRGPGKKPAMRQGGK